MDFDIDDFLPPAKPAAPAKPAGMSMRPYQLECIEQVEQGWREGLKSQLAVLATGCHAAGTPILMHDGHTKLVEDVAVGDRLMGWDNTPRPVLRLARGRQEMARIIPVKGEPFVVNLDHILTLVRTPRSSSLRFPSYQSAVVDVSVRDYLGWSKTAKHMHKLLRSSCVDFTARTDTLPISPYFLGVFLGDGSCKQYTGPEGWVSTKTPVVTTGDFEIAQACEAEAMKFGCGVRSDFNSAGSVNISIGADKPRGRGHKNPLAMELVSLGVAVDGGEKFIPDAYRLGDRNTRNEILAGLIDTDGHLHQGTFDYISQSKRLSDDVAFVARSLGLAAYVKPCEKRDQHGNGGTYYRVCISGDIDTVPTRVPRQQAKPRQQKKSVLRTGFTIELLPEDDFYGFSIEGDGRFLMGDFTVTHNCGKTVIFSEITKHEVKAGHKVLILAHSDELIEQARDKFQRMSGLKAAKEKAQDYASRWDNVVVGSVQTLCRDARLKTWPKDHFDLIVVDESHRVLAESYLKIINYFTARILGVTATADRGDKRALGEVFQRIAYEYGILQAVRDGWLVRPVVQTVPLELDLRGVHVANTGDGRDLDRREVSERIKPFLGIIAAKIREFAANRKILCFLPSVETARDLAVALQAVGFTADYVSGACTDRDEKVKRYKSGEIQALANCMLLTEGFDHDEIDVVVCLRPTKIRALYMQIVGRGTRPLNTIVGALNAAGTAQERRAIIAASAKPHLTLLDFLWLYEKHDLIRPASLVAKSKEEAEMMAGMGDGDLLEQEERAERDLLAKLEAEVRKNARKAAKRIDPLTCVEELGDPALIDYEPQTQREAEAPTEPQLRFLSQQGIDVSKVTSKGLASALTGRIIQRHKSGLCTMRQLHFFSQLGIDAALFTRDEAHKLMSEKIAGWRTRSATVLTSRTDPAP